jgi:hypothetical protein
VEHSDKNTKEEIIVKDKDNSPKKKHDFTKDDFTKIFKIQDEV